MKLLDGRDVAEFIQERHVRAVRAYQLAPQLAIVRQGATPATDMYLRVKQRYGDSLGFRVSTYTESPATLMQRIVALNDDPDVTAINVELPFADDESLVDAALVAVAPAKDVEGFAPGSTFEVVTPKAILWLLAAYNIDLKGHIAVVGQGRLVGRPLADLLEAAGRDVVRIDEHTKNLEAAVRDADIIITATGQPGLITPDMVKKGAVVVDAGAPKSDLDPALYDRVDLKITPNPGGVGPMTVAALFDNVLIAAGQAKKDA